MAKVTGPLMSMDASGKFAGALVFTKWKGRPVVRQLVTPANPQSALQGETRTWLRLASAAQKFINRTALIRTGETKTDKQLLIEAAPSGQAWNGFLVKSILGPQNANIAAADTIWGAFDSTAKTNWNTAAAALTPEITAVAETLEGGEAGSPMAPGFVMVAMFNGFVAAGIMTGFGASDYNLYA